MGRCPGGLVSTQPACTLPSAGGRADACDGRRNQLGSERNQLGWGELSMNVDMSVPGSKRCQGERLQSERFRAYM